MLLQNRIAHGFAGRKGGIHLVRQLMDELHYHRRGGRNVVVLVKRLPGGNPRSERRIGEAMEIATRTHNDVTLVAIVGSLDSNTTPLAVFATEADALKGFL